MKWASKWPVLASVALLLIAAAGGEPYGFYVLVRLVVCVSCGYLAVAAHKAKREPWMWIMGALALLFNPVLPVRMARSDWAFFDLVGAGLLAAPLVASLLVQGRSRSEWAAAVRQWLVAPMRAQGRPHSQGATAPPERPSCVAATPFEAATPPAGTMASPAEDASRRPPDRFSFWWWLSFRGRIPRKTYWLAYLLPLSLGLACFAVIASLSGGGAGSGSSIAGLALLSFFAIYVWGNLAGQVKRLHDRGKTGLWVLINLVPVLGSLYLFVHLGFMKGEPRDNRFGPDPLAHYGPLEAASEKAGADL